MFRMMYGKAFSLLKLQVKEEWQLYTNHRFVKQLLHNELEKKVFLDYLIQDYLFLYQFSKAWSLAIVKADNLKEMKLCAETVNQLINFEMSLHEEICEAYGITKKKLRNTEEKNKNIAYTRFVLEKGYSGDFLDLLTALMPCVLGYAEIGRKNKKIKPIKRMYREWLNTYSGKEYQKVSKNVGKLYDEATISRLGINFINTPKWKKMISTFKTATLLEIDFWEMSYEKNNSNFKK